MAEEEVVKYEFDEAFCEGLVALCLRDSEFMRRSAQLVEPSYFEKRSEQCAVQMAKVFFSRYDTAIDNASIINALKDAISSRIVRDEDKSDVKALIKKCYSNPLPSRAPIEEKIASFARQQAIRNAMIKSVDWLQEGKFDKIEQVMKEACEVGVLDGGDTYDYFEKIEERTKKREEQIAGILPPTGITTGIAQLDAVLYHRGWGRRELVSIMGSAKSGKSASLINFAKNASMAGYNVLYVTLEVSASIISERLDACLSDKMVNRLADEFPDVRNRIKEAAKRAGKLYINEFPSGSMTSSMLRRLLDRYRALGTQFDLICVDYADIMAPNFRTKEVIENMKSIYIDLRAIAFDYNAAVLTATQTNREGAKSAVAKAEHVSEDFNKVRTVDLLISINKTEEEASRHEARLYFAASRNQESGFTVRIEQDMAKMQFIKRVLRIE